MRIAVVDDDIQMYEHMRTHLDELLAGSSDITYFPSGEDFMSHWQAGAFDLVILDIFMTGMTGMDVAREMRKTDQDVRIVFSTTSNEFASESYEVNACYYLRKPFGRDKIKAMFDRLNIAEIEKLRSIKLPDGTSAVLRSIIFADCAAHCVTLHCKQKKDVTVRTSFAEIESLLCAYPYFFSPSKGIIVNFYEVEAQSGDTFRMSDGGIIPISRRKSKEVLDAYSSFLFEKLRSGGGR